jgi:hypothetical protein
MSLFDYIPEIYFSPNRRDVKFLLRKRIFHGGWQLLYCRLPAIEDIWEELALVPTKEAAMHIIIKG